MTIDSMTVRGGIAPWVDTVVEWDGTGTTWTLTNTKTSQVLYVGTAKIYYMDTLPETIYWLRVADDTGNTQTAAYVTPPISAPVNVLATNITDTTADVDWMLVEGATQYEAEVDGVARTVPPPVAPAPPDPMPAPLHLTGLEPDRTYEVRVRAFIGSTPSLWAAPIFFTTERTLTAESSVYEYEPTLARTWAPSGWRVDGSMLIHGDGALYGNPDGIHTTVFMYSAASLASLRQLAGVEVLTVEVSLTRAMTNSDPRMSLSHWMLHNMATIPGTAPTFITPAMGVDSGQIALGEQEWVLLPTGWADAIINGTATGIGWGGVSGRYMLAEPVTNPTPPINGTLRITVG